MSKKGIINCTAFLRYLEEYHDGDLKGLQEDLDKAAVFFSCLPLHPDTHDYKERAFFCSLLFSLRDVVSESCKQTEKGGE